MRAGGVEVEARAQNTAVVGSILIAFVCAWVAWFDGVAPWWHVAVGVFFLLFGLVLDSITIRVRMRRRLPD